jgi:hypothetical protein
MCMQGTNLKSHVLARFIAFIAIALDRWSYEPPHQPPILPPSRLWQLSMKHSDKSNKCQNCIPFTITVYLSPGCPGKKMG